jgi:transcriptional regulator with XRE-family HTH domain
MPKIILDEKSKARIRRLYKEEGLSQPELAERFGVKQSRISQILKEENLGFVPDEVAHA